VSFLIFFCGIWVGFLIGFVARSWLYAKFKETSGTIVVNRNGLTEKTVYSLVLDDYPEKLEFKKLVIFKVDVSDSNRE
jgi:hypothetical protein